MNSMPKHLADAIELWAALFLGDHPRMLVAASTLREKTDDRYMREVLHFAHLFLGFPRVVQALNQLPPAEERGTTSAAPASAARQQGELNFREVYGEDADAVLKHLRQLDARFTDLVVRHAYGMVFANSQVDLITRERLSVLALLATNCELQARSHIRACLRHGVSAQELEADFGQSVWLTAQQIALGKHCLQEEQARRG